MAVAFFPLSLFAKRCSAGPAKCIHPLPLNWGCFPGSCLETDPHLPGRTAAGAISLQVKQVARRCGADQARYVAACSPCSRELEASHRERLRPFLFCSGSQNVSGRGPVSRSTLVRAVCGELLLQGNFKNGERSKHACSATP